MSNGAPSAEVRLDGDAVHVVGAGLQTPRNALFFRTVLGGSPSTHGWECPTRGRPGGELVLEIVQRLERLGYHVTARGNAADRAMTTEIERVRSFGRARAAATGFLGLAEAEPVSVVAEDDVIEVLRGAGWNFAERDPLPHQRHGILHALNAVNAANFSVPGAGKTATALAVAATHIAQGTIDLVLVVGPLSSFAPWEYECSTAVPGFFNPRRVRAGSRAARTEIYRRARQRDLLLLSFATAASDSSELQALCRRASVMLVVDESHRVKRFRGGQWAPALVEIARYARVKLILSGTPMPQSALDLYSQLNILWPGGELTGSRATYAARADSDFPGVIRRVEPFFVRTPKSQLDLPEARFYRHDVALAPLQSQIYDLIVTRLRAQIPDAARWQERIGALRRASLLAGAPVRTFGSRRPTVCA